MYIMIKTKRVFSLFPSTRDVMCMSIYCFFFSGSTVIVLFVIINEFAASFMWTKSEYARVIKRENEGKFNLQANSLGVVPPLFASPADTDST